MTDRNDRISKEVFLNYRQLTGAEKLTEKNRITCLCIDLIDQIAKEVCFHKSHKGLMDHLQCHFLFNFPELVDNYDPNHSKGASFETYVRKMLKYYALDLMKKEPVIPPVPTIIDPVPPCPIDGEEKEASEHFLKILANRMSLSANEVRELLRRFQFGEKTISVFDRRLLRLTCQAPFSLHEEKTLKSHTKSANVSFLSNVFDRRKLWILES